MTEHISLEEEVKELKKELAIHQYYLSEAYTNRNNFQWKWDGKITQYKNHLPYSKESYDYIDKIIKDAEAKEEILPQEYYQLREELTHQIEMIEDIQEIRKDADPAFVDPHVPDSIRQEYEAKFG
ncbi:hypothetical protein BCPG3_015 [Bacillus phage BCPG3]|nr:hypothetical protein BPS13_0258 [Bacillus phage BPS13]AEZ50437.1 hypothetical protein BPS13_0258 [Bacillus phage BPS13]QQO38749.1 hypothetical protein BCPG1_017 [Bacillus phage BCPG1]QSJ04332.1 hypothetical protein BCPG3_015 [Bacillus phage BCPG3]QSJ04546.1 hypothetical protein BCP18_014 [Bacillus phage BCP18]